jgi:transcriptional regulator with GAF, ATPase, and Fis domain
LSRAPRVDPVPHLAAVAAAMARRDQPAATYAALDTALHAVLGHKLFTILRYHADTGESERVWTNRPAAYPVAGRKALNATFWSRQVLEERRPYLGRTAADIRSVFFDHELIASLGCASVLNLPVVWNDRVLGTINLLHEAEWYDETDAAIGLTFAGLAVPGLTTA